MVESAFACSQGQDRQFSAVTGQTGKTSEKIAVRLASVGLAPARPNN